MKAPWNFLRFLPRAKRLLAAGRLPALLIAVSRKMSSPGQGLAGVRDTLGLLQALCVAWWRGDYRAISSQALISIVAGLLYFVSPLDAIPDWIPGVGLLDDLAVLGWVARSWASELEAFKRWRDVQSQARQAALLDLAALPDKRDP
ncbi:DUF1232 domain-containing protein [Pseudomonas sp. ABC1]|uniref:YkvA family protein n=1 Tax=Pseudomonas sp. ABC1 TaxID=2748080 RepID=UPI0015C2E172|nr:YkvA family protein [Pseudomonas sp. ABC1]QLF94586.1 DUF1232 domain-containing protein [Pseudomonas sp. ABC1]